MSFGCGLCGQCGQPLVTGCGLVMLFAPPQLRDGDAVQLQPGVPELRHPGHLQELQGGGSLIPPTRAAGSPSERSCRAVSLPHLLLPSSPVNPGDSCHGGGHPGVAQVVQRRAVRGCRCHDHGAGHGACKSSRQRRTRAGALLPPHTRRSHNSTHGCSLRGWGRWGFGLLALKRPWSLYCERKCGVV